jgi:hypothetical protein
VSGFYMRLKLGQSRVIEGLFSSLDEGCPMVRIVIELPDQLKDFGVALQNAAERMAQLAANNSSGKSMDYAKIEREVGDLTAAVERAGHQGLLAGLDLNAAKVVIDGALHTRVGRCEGAYHTMAGSVSVERSLYRRDGERNSKVVDTISLRVGVVADGWLPQTARAMAHHVQAGTARDAEASAGETGRLVYSRCSFERVTHAIGELYGDRNVDIDDALITAYEAPAETRSVSVGLDRVSLPTIEPRPRPPGRPKADAPKRPITVAWRMMWVATVTLHDRNGDALHTIRYGAMPDDGCESLLHGAAGDVNELLRKKPRLKVCLLSDGAHDLVEHLATEVAGRVRREVMQGVDFWHLIEKLGAAVRLLEGDPEKRLARWRLHLLNVERAAVDILGELRASDREHIKVGEAEPVHEAITYLENHHDKMNYAALRAAGLPIGSGNTEATCKTLVEVRMKRAGSRWNIGTARHIVQLRALATSDRWREAMALTLRPWRKSVRVAA